ncbi:hypothetical protein B0A49_08442 [Cryomyces minteri]|uniref:Response regulatory domain-containing protein n=1 Tax=Cryomyces minteri TaxID=331657 RepID=A0A4U0X8J9_9PEZI|nr:hypothetical protein B0A49_08442 [Cryomyces minteri]
MNRQKAVQQWRKGGFHLVLMNIQLPLMSGLEATKEIRRLERVNALGMFNNVSSAAVATTKKKVDGRGVRGVDRVMADRDGEEGKGELGEEDRLQRNAGLFKSPPVNFVWLERKVNEWGCMQALIDFDGWRKWKVFAA